MEGATMHMNGKFLLLAPALLLAACAQSGQKVPIAEATPAATQGSAPPPGHHWDVTQIRCEQLLGADDDDRAAASMFYYGYIAARSGLTVIDTSTIQSNLHLVMEQCGKAPTMTVPDAFAQALGTK
jgi:HdeA/HdeB family protein